MKIKQFLYSTDNLGYLVYLDGKALAIDGGAVDEIMAFAGDNRLTIEYVVNTHNHPDHTQGNRELLERTKAGFLDMYHLIDKKSIDLGREKIEVIYTPGHTDDSVVFHFDDILVTGDTLFNGTMGNCFSDDMKGFFDSLKKLLTFPGDTKIYAGHDYLKYSMAVAKSIEPENPDIDSYLAGYDPKHVVSTLEQELKVNPFIRFNDETMKEILARKGLPDKTEFERWESLMTIY